MNDNFGFAQVVPDPLKISLKPFEAKSENGKKDKQAKKDLAADLHSHIVSGSIANRNQLIGYMKKKGLHIALIGDEFITVRLPGADKNTRLKGPLFSKDSDYAALVEEHHRSKIPKYLTPAEAADQRTKLVDFIAARTVFNQRRYLTPRPGAKRVQKLASGPTGGIRKGGRDKEPTTPQHDTTEIRSKLEKLKEVRDHTKEVQPGQQRTNSTAPHRVARAQQEREHASSMPSMGSSAVGGLEAQIGGLSMQYHNLLLLLAGATGRRAAMLQAQIVALQQKLTELNLELEKRKLKEAKYKDPKSQI